MFSARLFERVGACEIWFWVESVSRPALSPAPPLGLQVGTTPRRARNNRGGTRIEPSRGRRAAKRGRNGRETTTASAPAPALRFPRRSRRERCPPG
eukprot:4790152-Pyramimonas_sp.AAC.1